MTSAMAISDGMTRQPSVDRRRLRVRCRRSSLPVPRTEIPSISEPAEIAADEIPTWIERVAMQFDAISALPDDWDSYGARAADDETLKSASQLLEILISSTPALTPPHINPTRDGGIQFEWETGCRYLEIEILGPYEAHYYFEDKSDGTCGEGRISEGFVPMLLFKYIERAVEV